MYNQLVLPREHLIAMETSLISKYLNLVDFYVYNLHTYVEIFFMAEWLLILGHL